MAVDINEIYNRFRSAAIQAVGPLLASVKSQSGVTPAIFQAKDRYPAGAYPMILINVGNKRKQFGRSTHTYYNQDGDLVTVIPSDYFVTYTIYSQGGGDAQQIADNLESSFSLTSIEDIFSSDNFGTIAEVFDITVDYIKDGDQVKEVASFIVRFSTSNVLSNTEQEILSVNSNLLLRYPKSDVNIATSSIEYP